MLPAAKIRTAIEERLFGPQFGDEPILWAPAAGGLSEAAVWRVQRGDTAFAVRRWWRGIDPRYVTWLQQTLKHANAEGLRFVAFPLCDDDDWPLVDIVADRWDRWEAALWKPGTSLSKLPQDAATISAAIGGLVAFHACVRQCGTGPLKPQSSFSLRMERLRSIDNVVHRFQPSLCEPYTELQEIVVRLPTAKRDALRRLASWSDIPWPLQLIHGDARPEHFLIEGNELTGLIDFGAMRVDTPLADLARLAGELAAGDAVTRDQVVEMYATASGSIVDSRAVADLDFSGAVVSGVNWLRWLSTPGGVSRDVDQVRERLRSILARLGGA